MRALVAGGEREADWDAGRLGAGGQLHHVLQGRVPRLHRVITSPFRFDRQLSSMVLSISSSLCRASAAHSCTLTSSSEENSAAGAAAAAPADAFLALPPEAPPLPFEGRLPPALAAAAEPPAALPPAWPLLAALPPAAAGFLVGCCCFGCWLGVIRGGGCPCGLKSSHSPSAPGNAPCAGKVARGCEMQQMINYTFES